MALSPFFANFGHPLFGFDDFFLPEPRYSHRGIDSNGANDNTQAIMPVIPNLIRNADMILQSSSPGYEIHEADGKFMISVDVPGVKLADISVQVEEDGKVLHISGERQGAVVNGNSKAQTMKFTKRFTIGSRMDVQRMTANLNNGVLTLTVPVKEKVTIPVQSIPITDGTADKMEN